MNRVEPPAGTPWDCPFDEAPLAVVDLEMTGLDPAKDRVVQVCVERIHAGQVVARLESFVGPRRNPGPTEIHGITADHLDGAPPFEDLAPEIERLLMGACFVAHGARWDIAFLTAELSRLGRSFACEHYLDTLALARRAKLGTRHRLADLAPLVGMADLTPHRAANDVKVTRRLLERLCGDLAVETPRALWRVATGARFVRPGVLEAADEALAGGGRVRVSYQPSGKAAVELDLQVTQIRRDLDPPVVLGYLLPTRGRRELRADRILRIAPLAPA